jgi:cobalamin biosynthesis protein CobD/CbiB
VNALRRLWRKRRSQKFMRKVHGWAALIWLIAAVPICIWLNQSVPFLVWVSVYAVVVSHWSAAEADLDPDDAEGSE